MTISNITKKPEFFIPIVEESVTPSEKANDVLDRLVQNNTLTIEEFDKIRNERPEYQVIQCGRGENGRNRNIVCIAALRGRIDLIAHMVKVDGPGILEIGSGKNTPLALTLRFCKYESAKALISLGANVNVIMDDTLQGKVTPLEFMSVNSLAHSDIVELLLLNGACTQRPPVFCSLGRDLFNRFCWQFAGKIAAVKQREKQIITILNYGKGLPPELGNHIASFILNKNEVTAHHYIEAKAIVTGRAQIIGESLNFPNNVTEIIQSYDDGEGYKNAQRARIAT
jgi:hypothetical protein